MRTKPTLEQEVLMGSADIFRPDNQFVKGTVKRVGRKYFFVQPEGLNPRMLEHAEYYWRQFCIEDWKGAERNYCDCFVDQGHIEDELQRQRDDQERRTLNESVRDLHWRSLTIDQLRRIKAILDEPKPSTPPAS